PTSVRLLLAVNVLPLAMVRVALVAGAVTVTLLMLVAVATPIVGVVSVGEVASTLLPVPVFVTLTRFLLASVATALDAVNPERLSDVPAAAPMVGVTSVGEVARTFAPEPVTVVIAVPLILKLLPVPAVSNVLLVSVSVVALPTSVSVAAGSVSTDDPSAPVAGETVMLPDVAFASATEPTLVPATPSVTLLVPSVVMPGTTCTPVVPVPSTMALLVRFPELVTVPPPAGDAHEPSPRQKVDELAPVPDPRFVTGRLPVTPVDSGRPVRLVAMPEAGVPSAGVTNVGDVAKTSAP